MKMYAIYSIEELSNLEFNHRKYCELNNIEYNKIVISNSLTERYLNILSCLQNNIGETLIFIDDLSFFKTFGSVLKPEKDIYVQIKDNIILDNFLVINSNSETIKIIHKVLTDISKSSIYDRSFQKEEASLKDNFVDYPVTYPDQNISGSYINVIMPFHSNGFDIPNVLVASIKHSKVEYRNPYFVDALCAQNKKEYNIPLENMEVYNSGKKNSLITLYTPEIKEFAIHSEINLKKYCLHNNITLYVYRNLTEDLKNLKVSGAWCKPWLLLENFDNHEYIGWIDSDILLSKNYKMNFNDDISVYADPIFYFNSGFMIYKTTEKNKKLLQEVIESFKLINGELSGVYQHGGDQPHFIDQVKKHYPDYTPRSSLHGNSHPDFPIKLSPYKDDKMFHFMGYDKNFRRHVMKAYNSILLRDY